MPARWLARITVLTCATALSAAGCSSSRLSPAVGERPSSIHPGVENRGRGEHSVNPRPLKTCVVRIGPHEFAVEIADTDASRARGLMWRDELGASKGMLFVYDQPQFLSFWMRNTFIPLDVAFVRTDGTISSILTMEPLTTVFHESDGPVRIALEANAGEFLRLGIRPGAKVEILSTDSADQPPSRHKQASK